MTECVSLYASLAVQLRHAPVWIVPLCRRQRGQSVDLAECLEPLADVHARLATPPLQCKQHVKVPERKGLNGKVQNRRTCAQFGKPEDAIELAHACRCCVPVHREPCLNLLQL